jgi:hypothetical protein
MSITIEGLNRRQTVLADIMWAMNSRDQVQRFIQTLPALQQAEARTVLEMMTAAVYDDIETVFPETKDLLTKYRL